MKSNPLPTVLINALALFAGATLCLADTPKMPKAGDKAPHLDDRVLCFFRALAHQIPNTENMTEKPASRMMTRNIDSTTDRVVNLPTL